MHLKEMEMVSCLMTDLEREMASLAVDDPRVKLLLGFTGIDYYGALLLIYEIGDITRFSDPKKLVSYIGLAPSLYQSGNVRWTGRITKKGNRLVRWLLTEAAHHAARHDPKMKPFYERIARRKGNKKAIVAVARKMLVSIYWTLIRDEQYHGHRDDIQKRKIKKLQRIRER